MKKVKKKKHEKVMLEKTLQLIKFDLNHDGKRVVLVKVRGDFVTCVTETATFGFKASVILEDTSEAISCLAPPWV